MTAFLVTISHNPNCGNALATIRAAGQEPAIVKFLEARTARKTAEARQVVVTTDIFLSIYSYSS